MKQYRFDDLAKSLYKNYGKYISKFRAIPYYIDMLRPVERRMLLSLYDVARNKFVKSAKVVGHCMGNYHPHAEAYNTLVRLVHNEFAIGQGNWGSKGLEEDPPAAMRYTEVKLNPLIEKLAFELIDFVEWKELEFENEPVYLPSPIPLGLIGYTGQNQGIAFHKTSIPTFKLKDLFTILFRYVLDIKDIDITNNIKPYLEGHTVISYDSKSILESGKGTCVFLPKYTFKNNKEVELYGVPQSKSKFYKYCEDNNLEVIDYTSKDIKIVVKSTTNRNINKDKFLKILEYKITYNIITVDDDGMIKEEGLLDILERCYSYYQNAYEKFIKYNITKIQDTIEELLVIRVIKQLLNKYNIKNEDDLLKRQELKSYDKDKVKNILSKYTIRRLVNIDTDISKYEIELKEYQNKLKNINKETINKVKELYTGGFP